MNINIKHKGKYPIAVVTCEDIIITNGQDALDLIATLRYETGCDRIVIQKEAVTEEFFRLSSGLAGEILQKFVNYGVKMAVYGDFSRYKSKPLRDFIYESNMGTDFFLTETEDEAVGYLNVAIS